MGDVYHVPVMLRECMEGLAIKPMVRMWMLLSVVADILKKY